VSLRSGSVIRILGDSNMHEWACDATAFESTIDIQRPAARAMPTRVQEARIVLPVSSLNCGNQKIDENLRKALDAADHPTITFQLTRVTFAAENRPDTATATVLGALTVSGTTRDVWMDVTVANTADGAMRIQGAADLQMSNFGVKAPTALLGLLKTKDDVVLLVDLTLEAPVARAEVAGLPTT
jgi:polyisoprenoid-binding protein YceI